jgi:hypothetical protein
MGPSIMSVSPCCAHFDVNRTIGVLRQGKALLSEQLVQAFVMITCFIRYEIGPFRVDAFEQYARTWGQAIPRCGVDLIGYYAPHEGSATTAYGVYNIESLAAYEAYRARLRDDPQGRENYAFAKREGFIHGEDRIFLRLSSAPHAALVKP